VITDVLFLKYALNVWCDNPLHERENDHRRRGRALHAIHWRGGRKRLAQYCKDIKVVFEEHGLIVDFDA
jgi:hypothetical protein